MNSRILAAFLREEDGQDLVEYSLLLAFIALAMVAVLGTTKNALNNIYNNVNTKLNTAG